MVLDGLEKEPGLGPLVRLVVPLDRDAVRRVSRIEIDRAARAALRQVLDDDAAGAPVHAAIMAGPARKARAAARRTRVGICSDWRK